MIILLVLNWLKIYKQKEQVRHGLILYSFSFTELQFRNFFIRHYRDGYNIFVKYFCYLTYYL